MLIYYLKLIIRQYITNCVFFLRVSASSSICGPQHPSAHGALLTYWYSTE